jgi:hypothetical protein
MYGKPQIQQDNWFITDRSTLEDKLHLCYKLLTWHYYKAHVIAYAANYRPLRIIDLGQINYRPPENTKCRFLILLDMHMDHPVKGNK